MCVAGHAVRQVKSFWHFKEILFFLLGFTKSCSLESVCKIVSIRKPQLLA